MNPRRFRVALSFAGEKRDFVEKVADLLAQRFGRKQILYDKYHEAEFARGDLGIYLPKLYGEESDLIVPVLCPNYDHKRWTGWEWLHIYGLMTRTDMKRVMPSRFDHAHADGLSPAAGFIELDHKTPAQFVALILERLALNEEKPSDFYLQAASEPQQPVIPNGNGESPQGETEIQDRIAERLGRVQESSDWFKQLATELESFPDFAPQLRRPIEVSGLVDWVRRADLPELPTLFHALDDVATPSGEADRQLALELLLLAATRHINFAQVAHPTAVGTDVSQHASLLSIPTLSNVLAGVCAAARMGLQIHVGSHAAIAGAIDVSVPRHRPDFDTLLLVELYPALLLRKFNPSDLGVATDSPDDRKARMEEAWAEVRWPLDKLRRQRRFVALCLRFSDRESPEERELMLKDVARACNQLVIGLQAQDQGLVQGLTVGDLAKQIQNLLRRIAPDR